MTKRAWLTTQQAALILGVTTRYMYDECVIAQRCPCVVIARDPKPGRSYGQRTIRIYPPQFVQYVRKYWPEKVGKWQAMKDQVVA